MGVNIFGLFGHKESGSETAPLTNLANSFIKKSGDVMSGALNMGNNRIVNIASPQNNSDAVDKSYCERNFLQKIVENNVLKIGTTDNKSVEMIKNNEPYLTLGDNYIDVNRKQLGNLTDATDDSHAINKHFFDHNAVHKGGEVGMSENLTLGTKDEKHVEFMQNNIACIILKDDIATYRAIDVNKMQIKNLRDPISSDEAIHKGYMDEKITDLTRKTEQDLSRFIRWNSSERKVDLLIDNSPYMRINNQVITVTKNLYLDNRTRIYNVPIPSTYSEPATKGYVDTKIIERNELISKNDEGIVFLKRDTDSYLNLNDNMINIEKDLNLNHGVRILNIGWPEQALDPVHKQYVDTRMVHIGGNESVIGGLKIGTTDNLPVYLIRNRDIFMALDNDNIDCKNHRVINISDPADPHDATNKGYVDSRVLTKNHVGYIPLNPTFYGFSMMSAARHLGNNILGNIFNDDINSFWEVNTNNNPVTVIITCPHSVVIWKMLLILFNSDIPNNFSINIYGLNDANERVSITQGISLQMFNGDLLATSGINFNNDNIDLSTLNTSTYYKYVIEFNRVNEVPASFKISRLQMFIYNY